MRSPGPVPPRLAEWVVARALPPGLDRQNILGDLREEYAGVVRLRGRRAAAFWFWRHALGIAWSYARPQAGWAERMGGEVRTALRGLKRSPGFVITIALTLGMGIGAGTAVFAVVDGVLFRPLVFDQPDELVRIWANNEAEGIEFLDATYQDVPAFRDGTSTFVGVEGLSTITSTFMDARGEGMETVTVARVTPGFHDLLGTTPILGRGFVESDLLESVPPVLISHSLWQRRFGSDPEAIGTMMHLDARGYTVLGVLPPHHEYPGSAEAWTSLSVEGQDDDREVHLLARLAPGASISQADGEVQRIAAGLAAEFPESHAGTSAWVQPLRRMIVGDTRTALLALLGAVGLVLVISCVNAASVLLARATQRREETAVRTALGATRSRIVTGRLGEGVILALGAAGVGLVVGNILLQAISSLSPPVPRLAEVQLDTRVMLVMTLVAVAVGALSSTIPAIHTTGGGSAAVSGGRGSSARRAVRLHSLLVSTEVALSTILVVLAVLLFGTLKNVVEYDRGFDPRGLVAVSVDPLHPPETTGETRDFFRQLVARVESTPGVRSVALSSQEPLEQRGFRFDVVTPTSQADEEPGLAAVTRSVTAGYFATTGIPILEGTVFGDVDPESTAVEAIVNARFVELFLPASEDAVGTDIRIPALGDLSARIVGVAGNVSPYVDTPTAPMIYLPFEWLSLPGMWVVVDAEGPLPPLLESVRTTVRSLDPSIQVDRASIVEESIRQAAAGERFNSVMAALFAILALGMAGVGVYGVTATTVAARRAELGIRRALGAPTGAITRTVAARIALLAVIGAAVGVVAALIGERFVGGLLVGVRPTDPEAILGVSLALLVATGLGALIPLAHAIRIDPNEALRGD